MLILDTTLRDGEQTPGLSLTPEKKLMIARKLDEVGVNIIEAGSACTSAGERAAIKVIANEGLKAEIASFARILPADVQAALDADVNRVCLVAPTSDLHISQKLKKTREQVLELTAKCIELAKSGGAKTELLAEDGSRTATGELLVHFSNGISAGADRVCVCDTVGVLNPEATSEMFTALVKKLKVPVAFHGHNDFGLAVANSLAAYRAGAGELHCTVNGLGERAGNAPLEEIALVLNYFYGVKTIELTKLYELSRLVETLTGIRSGNNKPLVGANAFTHESGIHVDGILKCASTYEPVSPEMIGRVRRFSFGKHSGRQGLKLRAKELGVELNEEQLAKVAEKVKELGDKGREVSDAELQVILMDVLGSPNKPRIRLDEMVAVTGSSVVPTASVKVTMNDITYTMSGTGDGPVDAALNAIEAIVGNKGISLSEYAVDAITGGSDALVHVRVKLKMGDKEVSSASAGTDIVVTSVQAVLKGINLLI